MFGLLPVIGSLLVFGSPPVFDSHCKPGFTCELTKTHISRWTRVHFLGPHQSSNERSQLAEHVTAPAQSPFNGSVGKRLQTNEMKVKEEDQVVKLPPSVALLRQQTNQGESDRLPER